MIYGHTDVAIEKEPRACRWVVKTAEGAVLLFVPWHLKYTLTRLDRRLKAARVETEGERNTRDALEMCIAFADLSESDKQRLEELIPGVTSKPAYKVDRRNVSWETEGKADEPARTPPETGRRKLWI
jgi:hypothetical protein